MLSKRSRIWSFVCAMVIIAAQFIQAIEPVSAAVVTITPGGIWNDSSGTRIQAHGGGIIKVGSTYYWLGEDKTNGSPFQNIKCYSSTDLKNWTFVRNVLTQQASGDLGPNRIVERPHVIYNASTSTYVMWMHIDNSNYSERRAGTATSNSVCGAYTYRGSAKPLNHDSLDDNLFLDGSTAYFMSEDRTSAKLQLYQLSSDYLTISSLVATLNQYESPAIVKVGSTYFMFGSHLTGWSTNDNQYSTATSLSGPWSAWRSFAPSGTNTCNSQTTSVLPVQGSSTTTYMLMADRWISTNLTDSRYIWEPLNISGTTASIACHSSWNLDAATGTWSGGGTVPTNTPAPTLTGTFYRLTNRNSGKVADVSGGSTADGGDVIQWGWNGGSNQQWQFQDAGSGYFRIVNRKSGKCLDVANNSTADGTNVDQWACNGGQNQQWQWVAHGSYFLVIGRQSNKCLDVSGASIADGGNVIIWTCNNGANQDWSRTQS